MKNWKVWVAVGVLALLAGIVWWTSRGPKKGPDLEPVRVSAILVLEGPDLDCDADLTDKCFFCDCAEYGVFDKTLICCCCYPETVEDPEPEKQWSRDA